MPRKPHAGKHYETGFNKMLKYKSKVSQEQSRNKEKKRQRKKYQLTQPFL